jgi:hypothetical protein
MKLDLFMNSDYYYLSEFIKHIPENFKNSGRQLHTGRNEIRVVEAEGQKLAIKSFNKISWANRLIFSVSKWSKANKTFNNAKRLLNKNVSTPTPVAYINIYNKGLLVSCYYVCLYSEYQSVEELFLLPLAEAEEGLKAFAHYTMGLYKAGVYHGDYNLSNVMYQQSGHNFDFTLIDINRMHFHSYSLKRGLRNLHRLQLPVEKLSIVAAEFARESNADTLETLFAVTLYQLEFSYFKAFLKKLKTPIKYFPIMAKTFNKKGSEQQKTQQVYE